MEGKDSRAMDLRHASETAPRLGVQEKTSLIKGTDDGQRSMGASSLKIGIAATFTADLIRQPLEFWMNALEIAAEVSLAPYAQVLQELLNEQSLLSRNKTGINILIIRLQEWLRKPISTTNREENVGHLHGVAEELFEAIKLFRARTNGPILIFFCPSSTALLASQIDFLRERQNDLVSRLTALKNVHCCSHEELASLYPVTAYEDEVSDRIANIPYTRDYFAPLSALLARRIAALVKIPYKVIAIDCDNTLWRGIVGEDGINRIEITPAHQKLQEMLVRQHDAGILLCLCSKNNPEDVTQVFRTRADMVLREDHLVATRINWSAKSENLQSLAEELNLGLDSFIFIDDNPIECTEVRARCPSVLVLQCPTTTEGILHFISHSWAFDRVNVTDDAKHRTLQYKENRARKLALEQAGNLADFIASLELHVDVSPMKPDQLSRVAELVLRTNQFNLTGKRYRSAEIEALVQSGAAQCFVTHVKDRFGDYGLTGAVLVAVHSAYLEVDTYVLSCRVLGRGVEHRIANELGRIARQLNLSTILLKYRETPRNEPARLFVEGSFRQFRLDPANTGHSGAEHVFAVPTEYMEGFDSASNGPKAPRATGEQRAKSEAGQQASNAWHERIYRLSSPTEMIGAIYPAVARPRSVAAEFVAPQTPIENAIATLWCDVLGVESVGVRDDFFENGGDSLAVVQMIARMSAALELEVSLGEFFEGPTIEQVARRAKSVSRSNASIAIADRGRPLQLSSGQHRLWFIDRLEGSSLAYHVMLCLDLRGGLNETALLVALDALLLRHEALRTIFRETDGVATQVILPAHRFALEKVNFSEFSDDRAQSELSRHVRREAAKPFDLSAGPLIRGTLVQLAKEHHALVLVTHHIVSDGWSIGVLGRDLGELYRAGCEERRESLSPLAVQYADYAQWQREHVITWSIEHLPYWQSVLHGAPDLLELPTDRPRPATQSYRGDSVNIALDCELTSGLNVFARRFGLTLAMVLLSAWSIVLARLSGQEDFVVGVPVANRRRAVLEDLIGFFVNTLPLRCTVRHEWSLGELLQQMKSRMVDAYAHQDIPFEKIVEALHPTRHLSYSAVFQVLFVLQNATKGNLQLPGLSVVEREVPLETAQFDLLLSLKEVGKEIHGYLNFATDLFERTTVERWIGYFKVVLREMVREPDLRVSKLTLLGDAERRHLIETLNATEVMFRSEGLVHKLVDKQATLTPDVDAVIFSGQSVTYRQLNARANRLAAELALHGVGTDALVGVCFERGIEMVIALLATIKAGAAYVPLDPSYPSERLGYMVEDARPTVVLTQPHLRETLAAVTTAHIECISTDVIGAEPNIAESKLADDLTGASSVYVIYTSGSTGRPKGTAMPHRAMVNLLEWHRSTFQWATGRRVLQFAALSFDVAFQEIFTTLCTGGTLVLIDEWIRKDAFELMKFLRAQRIQTLFLPPLMLQSLAESFDGHRTAFSALQDVIVAGEQLRISSEIVDLFKQIPGCRLHNHYGPTETHVVTTLTLDGDPRLWPSLPTIGRPIANTEIYVLDANREPALTGAKGEIHIGGEGLARGYFARPALTAERFIPNPFGTSEHLRLYRTGDVGRWATDGTLEYLGRNDDQVKIRGFRIELGEIEAQLARHHTVKEVAVLAREDGLGQKCLVAYLTLRDPDGAAIDLLRGSVKAALPDYMVPRAFVVLNSFPRTPNGKLDRRSLPAPALDAYDVREYESPVGKVEETLADIWKALLGIDRVGRKDNFFELGGHSLLIVQMLEHLRRGGYSAEVRSIFASSSLMELAETLTMGTAPRVDVPENLIPMGCEEITPEMLPLVSLTREHIASVVQSVPGGSTNVQDIYPLAPLQEGILFHYLLHKERGDTYARPLLFSLSSHSHVETLIAALQAVIDRHDILRTAIVWERVPQPVQVVYRRANLKVVEKVLDPQRDFREQLEDLMRPQNQKMDLRVAPLMRLELFSEQGTDKWFALLQTHHLVLDNESLETLLSETMACFLKDAENLTGALQYRAHVAQALANSNSVDAEAFFRGKFGDVDEPTAPFGLFDVHGDGTRSVLVNTEVDPDLAIQLRAQARRLGVSPATLFHVMWALVVAHTSGRDDVVFGTVLLGRMLGSAGSQSIVGMFINTLPIRVSISERSVKSLVELTHSELSELLEYEQSSLAVAQRCSGTGGLKPLFTTLLNYRHSVPNSRAKWTGAHGVTLLSAPGWTNYPIVLSVDERGDGYGLELQVDRRVDCNRLLTYVTTALKSLVDALATTPRIPALQLPVMPNHEWRLVMEGFNATEGPYPRGRLIQELFEEKVFGAPDAVAVISEQQTLTYAELNRRANQLAHYLMQLGVCVGEFIPVLMPRGLPMLIAQLAVLKSGGAFVPIDPELPLERKAFIIRDCRATRVLTEGESRYGLEMYLLQWINCAEVAELFGKSVCGNTSLHVNASLPAYVMYTSGSTGLPKGVVVPHSAVNRLVINNGYAQIEPNDCMAHCSNPAFDASTFEVWGALLNGARVLIVSHAMVLAADRFAEVLSQAQVTVLWLTTGLFMQYVGPLSAVFGKLKYLLFGGEVVNPEAVRRVLNAGHPRHLLNCYGPTEGTTFSTTYLIDTVEEGAKSISIGRPIANTKTYVLDQRMQPVPIGVSGEIYIGGAGIALAYLNRPELTAERFIADPFDLESSARLYKTGDRGLWRGDGNLEYLGRNDNQVKIRGFRIEMGEIEAQLRQHENVKEAIVLVREGDSSERSLVAYVVPRESLDLHAGLRTEELYSHLKATLPEYMLPTAFVILERLPLTPNGKLDRRALPTPELAARVSRRYEAPLGKIEEALALVWQELLCVEQVGRQDHFFELGGHSILALKLVVKVNESLGVSIAVADIYKGPTLQEMAARVGGVASSERFVDLYQESKLENSVWAPVGLTRIPSDTILLTGSTGFVGRFLLRQLLAETPARIFCLVRGGSQQQAATRLKSTFIKWDLWREEFEHRLIVIHGDLGQPRLGIESVLYEQLSREVASVYHCGTSMNHLESYAMAKSVNVAGVKELMMFATKGGLKQVNYVSTLSVFSVHTSDSARVIDECSLIDNERHPTSDGYSASKWVGEKIAMTAAERGIPCNVFRLGLVWADAERGRYDELQREYRILKSSILSGVGIQNYCYDMAPVPVDYVARSIVALAGRYKAGGGLFHIALSDKGATNIFEHINQSIGTTLILVSEYEWISRIKHLYQNGRSLPAVPVVEYAFRMDERSFKDWRAHHSQERIRFDCERTHRELQNMGIIAPIWDDSKIERCLQDMFARDDDLRAWLEANRPGTTQRRYA